MEAEVVGCDTGVTSSSMQTTATETDNTFIPNEPSCGMPAEVRATESQLPRPRIQYSTDLRKELSLDVLASLGDSSADERNSVENSLMDLVSIGADMEFISELSSLALPPDQPDPTGPNTFLTSSSGAGQELESSDAPPTANASLLGSDFPESATSASTLSVDPLLNCVLSEGRVTSGFASCGVIEGPCEDALAATLSSSAASIVNAMSAVDSALIDDCYPVSAASTVVLSPQVASAEDALSLSDGHTAEPSSSDALQEFYQLTPTIPPVSGTALALPEPGVLPDSLLYYSITSSVVDPSQTLLSSVGIGPDSDAPADLAEASTLAVDPVSCTSGLSATAHTTTMGDRLLVKIQAFISASEDNVLLKTASEPNPITCERTGADRSVLDAVADYVQILPPKSEPLQSAFTPVNLSDFGTVSFRRSQLVKRISRSPAPEGVPITDAFPAPTFSIPSPSTLLSAPNSDAALESLAPSLDLPRVVRGESRTSPSHTGHLMDGISASVPSPSSAVSLSTYFDGSRTSFRGRKGVRKRRSPDAGADEKDMKEKGLSDAENMEDVAELESMLENQKKMLQWQIDEMQRITALQCQLFGTNPLSDNVVCEILGIKGGGKKSGDLSPDAFRYLQEIFAIKDTITKKEARDISATSGASLTQVREFFAAQRSLVRKLVQQAHDEAGRLGIKNASEHSQQIQIVNTIAEVEEDLGFDKLAGIESMEKLLELMQTGKGFARQSQLLQVILNTDPTALVLRRLLEKGCLKFLGGWLVEAAAEEQTSVISRLLKVFEHLPLGYAMPNQMPPLVQNVNKLRFYHIVDVSGQARSLLTKWSKMFLPKTEEVKSASSPGRKLTSETESSPVIPSVIAKRIRTGKHLADILLLAFSHLSVPRALLAHPLTEKLISGFSAAQAVAGSRKKKVKAEMVQQEIQAPPVVVPGSSSLNGVTQGTLEHPSSSHLPLPVQLPTKPRWSSTLQPSESAVAAVSVSRKRLASKSLGDQSKDRRKVLLVEDSHVGKGVLPTGGSKAGIISKNSRPLSTDDIYKAKKLERLMQEPLLKSRRRQVASQEPSEVKNVISEVASLKRASPLVPEHLTAVRDVGTLSQSPDVREASRTTPSQGGVEILRRTSNSTKLLELCEDKRITTPTSSQEILQMTSTVASSQKLFHPEALTCDVSEDIAQKGDSAISAELTPNFLLPSPFASSIKELAMAIGPGRSSRTPVEVNDLVVVDSTMPDNVVSGEVNDASYSRHKLFSQKEEPVVQDRTSSFANSRPIIVGDICTAGPPSKPSKSGSEDLSRLPMPTGIINVVDQSAADLTGVDDGSSKEGEIELQYGVDSSLRETTLINFYAALRASMIRWRIPPEFQPDAEWNLAAGEDSKEMEAQSGRVKREEEAYYAEPLAIPDNPKDPWEEEPNYDDSLTLEIFVDSGIRKVLGVSKQIDMSRAPVLLQLPTGMDASLGSENLSSNKQNPNNSHGQEHTDSLSSRKMDGLDLVLQQLSAGSDGTHDPDLLALLLRNPELVTQLTARQGFTPSGLADQGVVTPRLDRLKQSSGSGNNGVGLSNQAGDVGQDMTTPNNSITLGVSLQPGRSLSSVEKMPSETLRTRDSRMVRPHPGVGQQQTLGVVPQGGIDSRFSTPQISSSLVIRNIQGSSAWEQPQVPAPPPLLPPLPIVTNQVFPPSLSSQPNKLLNWSEPLGWAGVGRPPMSSPKSHQIREQIHLRQQTVMTHNTRPPDYGVMVSVPQVDVGCVSSLVSQQEIHHSQRSWSNGSQLGAPLHENATMHAAQELSVGRNNRWPRPPGRPPDHLMSSGVRREFAEFNGRQSNVLGHMPVWVPNERAGPGQPFQGGHGLPHPPQYPLQLWQGQDNRPGEVGMVHPFPHGRQLRQPQQTLWHSNMGPSRQTWRGQ